MTVTSLLLDEVSDMESAVIEVRVGAGKEHIEF